IAAVRTRPFARAPVTALLFSALAAAAVITGTGSARALGDASSGDEPETAAGTYSAYEERFIKDAERDLHVRVDPSPEGKIVEGIDVVTVDVIDRHDPVPASVTVEALGRKEPLPRFVNYFHATSRRPVI